VLACISFCLFQAILVNAESRQLLGLRGGTGDEKIPKEDNTASEVTSEQDLEVTASNLTIPLHAHSGTHHVHVYIGSPPQRQTLIVDTGSRVMAFPCKPCRFCGKHASPYFDTRKSTTKRLSKCGNCKLEGISTCSLFGDQCEITQKYTEGSSWSAHEIEDMVWLGNDDVMESIEDHMQLAISYAFGCQTSINGLFQKQYADGILGLARHDTSLVAAYYRTNAISRNAFSLCLTADAGYFALGGSMPVKYHLEEMKTTPITKEHGWYSVEVTEIWVGGIRVVSEDLDLAMLKRVNAGKGCILDSGTTDTYLPSKLQEPVGEAAMRHSGGMLDFTDETRVRNFSFEDFHTLPDLTFVFAGNVTLVMEAKQYMEGVTLTPEGEVQSWEGTKVLTNRVYLEEDNGAVLGANAMLGYDILFDSQAHHVGIARAQCHADIPSIAHALS